MAPVLSVKAMKNHSAFTAIVGKILANLMAPASNLCKIFFLSYFYHICFFVFPFQRPWDHANSRERTTLFH